jgi:hypothetical protein
MKRLMTGLVIGVLALPLAVLGAMVGDAERNLHNAETVRVAIRGYDPRDMLRGHYLNYQFDWNAELPFVGKVARLCVVSATPDAPARVRPVAPETPSTATDGCMLLIEGTGRVVANTDQPGPGARGPARRLEFWPSGVAIARLYVSERHAERLEALLRDGSARLTIDLAVTRTGQARVKAWHIDGHPPATYFSK